MLGSGAKVAAADVLVAAAMVCPNKLPDGIPKAGAANELPALPDWPNKLLDGFPKAGAANEFAAALDWPNKLLDGTPNAEAADELPALLDWPNKVLNGVPKAGAANELPAVLDCPNKPLGCRPSDAAVVLAAVFAGADVAAGASLDDGRACEVEVEEAEDWKRPAVADAAGKPPGCGGFCTHITERKLKKRVVHSY